MVTVFHVGDTNGGIGHSVVDDCINRNCYGVFGQDLNKSVLHRDNKKLTLTHICDVV